MPSLIASGVPPLTAKKANEIDDGLVTMELGSESMEVGLYQAHRYAMRRRAFTPGDEPDR
jgi:hypothetical protein